MKNTTIANRGELQSEIQRLITLENAQRIALAYRFSSPAAICAAALTLFPGSAAARRVTGHAFFQQDLFSLMSRFLIPMTLNKTIFRRSGFLVKLLVGLVSQKAAGYFTESAMGNLFAEGKSFFGKLLTKKEMEAGRPSIH
jgi:hypothetical protein